MTAGNETEEDEDTIVPRKLACFVRPQLFCSSSSASHMEDINVLLGDSESQLFLKNENGIRPVWFFVVDGGPDENPRHLKNVSSYCSFFKKHQDIDYLSVRTYAPGQSAFNLSNEPWHPIRASLQVLYYLG
jgi:hypothetical protein